MRRAIPLVLIAVVVGVACAETDPPLVVRHAHYFVIAGDADEAPTISAQSRSYYTYADDLKLRVTDDQSQVRLQRTVALGGSMEQRIPGDPAPLYLVMADPGMNGVIFDCDRPWGVVAAGGYGLGSNGKAPPLHLYVPPECEKFTVEVRANSPREGLRLVVSDPEGAEALVIDGEADELVREEIVVPAAGRGKVWTFTLSDPQTVEARLDDIQLWVGGYVAPLLWPDASWAEAYGPMIWQRQKAVLDAE
ncbi:MAG: hypothetical protein J7M38_09895 [Armatimonadetes bacterium]|nr:hypothetical protein [Armatimonadota bacterium]